MKSIHTILATALTGGLLLTGCSSQAASERDAAGVDDSWPRTVENCGREVTIDAPPERIVSGWPTSTETLLELGAADRISGQYNTSNGEPTDKHLDAYAEIKVLGEGGLGREQLLAAEPDLIWADGSYLFDGTQLPTIEDLQADGIPVLILSGFCTGDASGSTVEDLFTDLDTIGQALGLEEEAADLAVNARARLDAVSATAGADQDIAMFGVFDGVVYGYDGVYSDMARTVGARNTFAGTFPEGSYFGEVSKEALIAQDPDALVYLYSSAGDRDGAEDYLRSTFSNLQAVTNDRIVLLPAIDSTNLRVLDGVETLAEGLQPGP